MYQRAETICGWRPKRWSSLFHIKSTLHLTYLDVMQNHTKTNLTCRPSHMFTLTILRRPTGLSRQMTTLTSLLRISGSTLQVVKIRMMPVMLRMMLGDYSSKQLIHFGHRFKVLGVLTVSYGWWWQCVIEWQWQWQLCKWLWKWWLWQCNVRDSFPGGQAMFSHRQLWNVLSR